MKYFYFFLILSLCDFTNAQSTNSFEFKHTTMDYGTIKQGEIAECEFVFTNTGEEEVEIKTVKSNSRNIKFKLKEKTIAPGQTSSITVIYNSEKPGPIRKVITVFTNIDPDVYTLSVKGRVLPKS